MKNMVPFINAFTQRVIDMSYNRAIWKKKKKKESKQNTKQPEQLDFNKTLKGQTTLWTSHRYILQIYFLHIAQLLWDSLYGQSKCIYLFARLESKAVVELKKVKQ